MTGPLTYPPEIAFESTVDLPPEYYLSEQGAGFDLTMLLIELVITLLLDGP